MGLNNNFNNKNIIKNTTKVLLITSLGGGLSGCNLFEALGLKSNNSNNDSSETIGNNSSSVANVSTKYSGTIQAGYVAGAEIGIYSLNGDLLYTSSTDENGNYEIDLDVLKPKLKEFGMNESSYVKIISTGGVDIDPDDDGNIYNDVDKDIYGEMSLISTVDDLDSNHVTPISTMVSDILLGENEFNLEELKDEKGKLDKELLEKRVNKILKDIDLQDVNGDGNINNSDLINYDMVENESEIETEIKDNGFLETIHSGDISSKNEILQEKMTKLNLVSVEQEKLEDQINVILRKSHESSYIKYSLDGENYYTYQGEISIYNYETDIFYYKEIYQNNTESKIESIGLTFLSNIGESNSNTSNDEETIENEIVENNDNQSTDDTSLDSGGHSVGGNPGVEEGDTISPTNPNYVPDEGTFDNDNNNDNDNEVGPGNGQTENPNDQLDEDSSDSSDLTDKIIEDETDIIEDDVENIEEDNVENTEGNQTVIINEESEVIQDLEQDVELSAHVVMNEVIVNKGLSNLLAGVSVGEDTSNSGDDYDDSTDGNYTGGGPGVEVGDTRNPTDPNFVPPVGNFDSDSNLNNSTNSSNISYESLEVKSFTGYYLGGVYTNYVTYGTINGEEHPIKVYGEYTKGGKTFKTQIFEIDKDLSLAQKQNLRDGFKSIIKDRLSYIKEFEGTIDFDISPDSDYSQNYTITYNSYVHYDALNKGEDYPARVWLKYNFGGEEYILESESYANFASEKDQYKQILKNKLTQIITNPKISVEGINKGEIFWNTSTQSYEEMIGGAYKIYEVEDGYIGVYKVANSGTRHTSVLKSDLGELEEEIKDIINNWYEKNKIEPIVEGEEGREVIGVVGIDEFEYTQSDYEADLESFNNAVNNGNYDESRKFIEKINLGLLKSGGKMTLDFLLQFKESSDLFIKGFATGTYKAGKDTIVGLVETPEQLVEIANTTIKESKKSYDDAVTWMAFGSAYINKLYQDKYGNEQDKQIANQLISQFSNKIEDRGEEVGEEINKLMEGLADTYELLKVGIANLQYIENPEYYVGYLTGYVDTMIAEAVATTYLTKKANIALTRMVNSKKYKDFVKMVALGRVGDKMELIYSKLNNLGDLKWEELDDLKDNVDYFIKTGACGIKTASINPVSYVNKTCNINITKDIKEFETILNLTNKEKSLLQNLLEKVKVSNLDYDFIKDRLRNKDITILKENINNIDEYIKSFEGGKYDMVKAYLDYPGSQKEVPFIIKDGKIKSPNGFSISGGTNGYDFIIQNGIIKIGKHHDFLSKGKNVSVAGKIYFTQKGKITKITEESGHYLPTLGNDEKNLIIKTFTEKGYIDEITFFQIFTD